MELIIEVEDEEKKEVLLELAESENKTVEQFLADALLNQLLKIAAMREKQFYTVH